MNETRSLETFTLIACLCVSSMAVAQTSTFPSKPIRLIMPFAPGGSADNLGRTIQSALGDALGQQIIIDNRPGASSVIGTNITARSNPDGYTLLLITTTYTVNPSLMKSLPFDPVKDLAGVSLLVSQANILAVHPSVPAKSVKELVELAKTKPLSFASGGTGSSPHLSGELLNMVAGVRMTHVPYKGSGPGVSDLIGGHVQLMFAGPLAFEQHIKAGRLRALAVADKKRSNVLPDLPTMTEAGFPGVETGTWYALLAPAATPRSVINKLNKAVVSVFDQPVIKQRMAAQGVEIIGSTPKELDQHIRAEIGKWAKLVKAANILSQ
ncbi:MAG: tripartite tricarboxylate transporter substrate binding protein [Betaproteobacteria bacterium]|nr:tripartite tricarboxylate transporter substrate binding protein [Betaproteobacteria bacterium]